MDPYSSELIPLYYSKMLARGKTVCSSLERKLACGFHGPVTKVVDAMLMYAMLMYAWVCILASNSRHEAKMSRKKDNVVCTAVLTSPTFPFVVSINQSDSPF